MKTITHLLLTALVAILVSSCAKIFYSPDAAQLCEILGVDGILSSNFGLSKPMSDGAAIAEVFLSDSRSPTNEVHASLSISDYKNNKLIWNYDYKSSGSLGSTSSKLVDDLMRAASRKMPYMN